MITKQTLSFLADLSKNNNKEWFDENRIKYEYAKANMIQVTDDLIKGIGKIDNTIVHLDAKSCLFRINRDTRFSKNKLPYKNNLGASINK